MNLSEIKIEDLLLKLEDFPTLPTIYNRMMDLMANPRTTALDIANLISSDQSAATKVLKAVNSPIYGLYGKITSISQAINLLGFDEIRNLITALTIIDLFDKNISNQVLNPVELWQHSIAVGIINRMIGIATHANNIENYFLAGILHDIGKLFFFQVAPQLYAKVIEYSIENKVYIRDAEMKLIGITHTVVGDLLAEKWRLPIPIRQAIRYHNIGFVNEEYHPLVASVHISNIAASTLGYGNKWEYVVQQPNIEVWKKLELQNDFFKNNIENIYLDYIESSNLLLKN